MNPGIYIHIPFCLSKCHYCHFCTQLWNEDLAERYKRAVVREIIEFAESNRIRTRVNSIYFGGGTPSLMSARQIGGILDACRSVFAITEDCEVSMEANPDTILGRKASAWLEMGINRISMGAQSFSAMELAAIGRIHSSTQIKKAFALLRQSGFENINLDLMLGLPHQSERQWMLNLETVTSLSPEHLSIYMLDLEGTEPLAHSILKNGTSVPDEDSIADWYLSTLDYMSAAAYDQYEISNFAFPGFQCRHNLKYWLRAPVLGFGLGSHSYDGDYRYANQNSMDDYLESIEGGRAPIEWRRQISEKEALQETFFLGLRLNKGIDWEHLECTHAELQSEGYKDFLDELQSMGLVARQSSNIHLTRAGMLLSNEILQRFV
jgi:oxygen-independent coproporphyrinogen III oxidase